MLVKCPCCKRAMSDLAKTCGNYCKWTEIFPGWYDGDKTWNGKTIFDLCK